MLLTATRCLQPRYNTAPDQRIVMLIVLVPMLLFVAALAGRVWYLAKYYPVRSRARARLSPLTLGARFLLCVPVLWVGSFAEQDRAEPRRMR